ncbi:desulforubrerythrin [Campylobacter blaseri]|uniref:Rubrerythrin family protein n=1 Tax=Campylobacter blaseri TaxID=2042961 RepID=A0A2P8R178_9BACT|nr:ferritin family protein [Campylobacter blaseri]PSM52255.1 rubrerythrin family protein [Campylobacter blaseri]PSM54021.1 rubrerythrin family protein [Campylobacter blaseri]QKF85459.1 desulforubrerythrin [Campylobacter blaseri]
MRQYETYKCEKCGNVVEVQEVGNGGKLTCCDEEMTLVTKNLTEVNLMKAFAGESMARNKYDLYGDLAKEAGYHAIARHFYEAAENEKWHARAEFKAYHELVGSPIDKMDKNLLDAAAGERYEHETMYPNFAEIAKEEDLKAIARLFTAIGKVEVEHEREYLELKDMLDKDGFFESEEEDVWVCEVCGHVHRGKKAPGACALCKAPKEYFKREFLG